MRKAPPTWAFVLAIAVIAVAAITGRADTWWLTAVAAVVVTWKFMQVGKQEQ